jgi:cytochrome c biogenesis protein CcdA/peroxiredoxin
MSGQATQAAGGAGRGKFATFLHGLAFVLGFTLFFVGFGLLTAAASRTLSTLGVDIPTILTRLGGVAVIFFGLYVMKALDPVFERGVRLAEGFKDQFMPALLFSLLVGGVFFAYLWWAFESLILAALFFLLTLLLFRRPLQTATSLGDFWAKAIRSIQGALISDTRQLTSQQGGGYLGSVMMGVVFSAGWTPCIGPIYGSVLTLATNAAAKGESLFPAAMMLTAYSLGLGLPFLATALALNQLSGAMKNLKRNMRRVELVSGVLLILIGVLILSGNLEELSRRFGNDGTLGEISLRLESCTAGAGAGRIQLSAWGTCVSEGLPKLNDRVVFASDKSSLIPTLGEQEPESSARPAPLFIPDPAFDPESVPVGLEIGQRAPDIESVTAEGEPIRLSDLRGQVVLVNFWATWCGPCGVEMPEFQSLYENLKERGFSVFAVDFLESPSTVLRFGEALGLTFPLVMDETGAINDSYRIKQYPTTFLLDGNGIILQKHSGPLQGDDVLAWLEALENDGQAG